jgi:hypothetical protein
VPNGSTACNYPSTCNHDQQVSSQMTWWILYFCFNESLRTW